jgi:hypothetical protein
VARALVNKGAVLGELGRNNEGLAVYDEVVGLFDTAAELPIREQVAKALFNKAGRLGQLGRRDVQITPAAYSRSFQTSA